MSCNVDYEKRAQYPKTVVATFMSYSGAETIPDINVELEKLGNATTLAEGPTPRYLRPITSIEEILNAQAVYIEKIEFTALDVTNPNSTYQDEATVSAIIASRTGNKAYAQSQYKNGVIPVNFQPNFFRPTLIVDGKAIIPALNSGTIYADLSIGIPAPTCIETNIELGKVNNIDFFCSFAQYIEETQKYQNYPVIATVTFWLGYGAIPNNQ